MGLADHRTYDDGEWTEIGRQTGNRVILVILADHGSRSARRPSRPSSTRSPSLSSRAKPGSHARYPHAQLCATRGLHGHLWTTSLGCCRFSAPKCARGRSVRRAKAATPVRSALAQPHPHVLTQRQVWPSTFAETAGSEITTVRAMRSRRPRPPCPGTPHPPGLEQERLDQVDHRPLVLLGSALHRHLVRQPVQARGTQRHRPSAQRATQISRDNGQPGGAAVR